MSDYNSQPELSAGHKDLLYFDSLYRITETLFSSLQLEDILHRIVTLAREVLGADYTSIVLVDDSGNLAQAVEDFDNIASLKNRIRTGGLTDRILASAKPVLVNDTHREPLSTNPALLEAGIRSYAGLPLVSENRVRGILFVHSTKPDAFSDKLLLMSTFSNYATIAIKNATIMNNVQSQAIRDGLTGLYNYRYFNERLRDEISRSERSSRSLALLLIDLDDFKSINDIHGHPQGDSVLKRVAGVLEKAIRSSDVLARSGGDEFVLLLPETDKAGALHVATKLKDLVVESCRAENLLGTSHVFVTASIGVAVYPEDARSAQELLSKADQEMFRAKRAGGNRVSAVFYSNPDAAYQNSDAAETSRRTGSGLPESFLAALSSAIDLKDRSSYRHSQLVSRLASETARLLSLSFGQIEEIRIAGMLHDIGKLSLPDAVLLKADPLSEADWNTIKRAPRTGEQMLNMIDGCARYAPIIRSLREHYDGSGYPDGLTRDQIPVGSRVIAAADAYLALQTFRPYRPARTRSQTRQILHEMRAVVLDPVVLDAMLSHLDRMGE